MIEFVKDGDVVATAETSMNCILPGPDGIERLDLFYFKRIKLSPIATFAHLAGEALIKFLDGAYLLSDGKETGPVRYIHGRSEVMRGNHAVSAVLVAIPKCTREFSASEWLSVIPEVYRIYLASSEEDRA